MFKTMTTFALLFVLAVTTVFVSPDQSQAQRYLGGRYGVYGNYYPSYGVYRPYYGYGRAYRYPNYYAPYYGGFYGDGYHTYYRTLPRYGYYPNTYLWR